MTFREDLTPRCFYGDTTIEEREVGKPYVSYKGIANQPLNRLVKPPTKEMDWQVHVHKFQKQPAS